MQHETFAGLGVSKAVAAELGRHRIEAPFAIQRLVIPDVLAGHDVLAQSPTGSGKTLAFGVPLVERLSDSDLRPSALVLAPTRELSLQIVEDLRPIAHVRALSIAAVYGGASVGKQARLAARAHVLVATPGRLLDLVERGDVSLGQVRLLVLDEADRMLDMGFRPAVDRLVRMTHPERQTLLFSATLEGEVGRVAKAYTSKPRRHEHAHPAERKGDVEHRFLSVTHEGKIASLVSELGSPDRGLTLVFVRTKRGADRLVKRLASNSVRALAMHGDKSQGQRERALASFQAGTVDTLVATDVAARGIDVDGITHVINYDVPATREDYVHRVGRTARAGASGVGVTLVARDQARELGRMVRELGLDGELERAGIGTGAPAGDGHRPPGRGPRRRSPGSANSTGKPRARASRGRRTTGKPVSAASRRD